MQTVSDSARARTMLTKAGRTRSYAPGKLDPWACGQEIQVASCGSHSAGMA